MEKLDYRQFLHEELSLRSERNPAYSARAMARDLDLSPPFLSQILSGTRTLGEKRAYQLSEKLPWPRWKKLAFVQLVRYHAVKESKLGEEILGEVKSILLKAKSKSAKAKFHKLCLDEFKVIADWHHMAIYEMTALKFFKSEPEWIAKKLGISRSEVELAIARLLQVRLLEEVDGQLQKSQGHCQMGAVPSSAIRSFHQQHLEKAKRAIDVQGQNERDFSGTTIAIDVKKLPRAKVLIRRFNQELMQLLESGDSSAVYHLAVQLYRLDSPEGE